MTMMNGYALTATTAYQGVNMTNINGNSIKGRIKPTDLNKYIGKKLICSGCEKGTIGGLCGENSCLITITKTIEEGDRVIFKYTLHHGARDTITCHVGKNDRLKAEKATKYLILAYEV